MRNRKNLSLNFVFENYETGLNIALDILHFMFPLSNYLYSSNKTKEIKLDIF